jgi:hypothetical protein
MGSSRYAKALEMILKITWISAIRWNCETKSATGTLDIRVRIAKFSLDMSMHHSIKSLRMCKMSCLILDQKCLKKQNREAIRPRSRVGFHHPYDAI